MDIVARRPHDRPLGWSIGHRRAITAWLPHVNKRCHQIAGSRASAIRHRTGLEIFVAARFALPRAWAEIAANVKALLAKLIVSQPLGNPIGFGLRNPPALAANLMRTAA